MCLAVEVQKCTDRLALQLRTGRHGVKPDVLRGSAEHGGYIVSDIVATKFEDEK